jgi:hypothetical protein
MTVQPAQFLPPLTSASTAGALPTKRIAERREKMDLLISYKLYYMNRILKLNSRSVPDVYYI